MGRSGPLSFGAKAMSTVPRRPKAPPRQAEAVRPAPASVITLEEHGIDIPSSALTLEGYRAWAKSDTFPERGRIVFLGGRLSIDMTPEELETHAKLKGEINRSILNLNRKLDLGEYYPDGVLLTHPEVGLSTEADAAFVCWDDLEAGKLRLIPRVGVEGQFIEVEGTPNWVLEIVSNSSVGKDTRVLRDLYHQAGIEEYWLIDARGADLRFEILLHGKEGYEAAVGKKGWLPSRVFGRRFRLTRERGRMHHWRYTLDVRPLR
jgi:Uma2 family endonuclease